MADYFKAMEIEDLVVVAVDIGISKRARDVAEYLDCPLAIIGKAPHRQRRPFRKR